MEPWPQPVIRGIQEWPSLLIHVPRQPSLSSSSSLWLKSKRKRASPAQLRVLNHVFNHTCFPSTELRMQLSKQLDMPPRTIQIWFQNKRQALKKPTRQTRITLPPLPSPTYQQRLSSSFCC
ncbi:homeobox-domain-containing protein [Hesseltinella vesiculosa]|uniref:Homeobox-domain-containing protein n=1 Tax=Hesseltinella vesiculosa TaxID=101127 RepID=A0A1X2GER2_9FUNG|nr:homeobox-domain-containing protein [Hesseltinella vesiculosa]